MISLTKLLVSVHTLCWRGWGEIPTYMRANVSTNTHIHITHTHTDIQPPGASANRMWALVGGGGGAHLTGVYTCVFVCVRKCIRMRIRVYVRVYAVGIGRVGRLHEIKWLLVTHRLPWLHTAHCTAQCNRCGNAFQSVRHLSKRKRVFHC